MSKSWYAFIGGDPTNLISYYHLTVKHGCLCGDTICAIYAESEGLHPRTPFSENMQEYILQALTTGQLQPQVPYNAKKYVYLKI